MGSQRAGHNLVTERQQLHSAMVDLEAQSLSKGWTFHGFAMSDILEIAGGISMPPERVPDGTGCLYCDCITVESSSTSPQLLLPREPSNKLPAHKSPSQSISQERTATGPQPQCINVLKRLQILVFSD